MDESAGMIDRYPDQKSSGAMFQSNIDLAMERCDKAGAMVDEAWYKLRERIDQIVVPSEPTDEAKIDISGAVDVRRPESRHRQDLNNHADRLERLAESIHEVTGRLDL